MHSVNLLVSQDDMNFNIENIFITPEKFQGLKNTLS